jgi:hypothetical protein
MKSKKDKNKWRLVVFSVIVLCFLHITPAFSSGLFLLILYHITYMLTLGKRGYQPYFHKLTRGISCFLDALMDI